jgi:hypothetical protein
VTADPADHNKQLAAAYTCSLCGHAERPSVQRPGWHGGPSGWICPACVRAAVRDEPVVHGSSCPLCDGEVWAFGEQFPDGKIQPVARCRSCGLAWNEESLV